jgi:hypothetical protein
VADLQGANWSAPQRITGAGAPPLYRTFVASGSNLHLLTNEGGHLYFRGSTDDGDTWSSRIRLSATDLQRPHRVALAVSGDHVHVVNSLSFTAGANRQIFYWRSANGGASFGSAVVLDNHPDGPVNASIASEGSVVHVLYDRFDDKHVYYLRSSDNGATWTDPLPISDPAGGETLRPRIVAVGGRVIASWQQDIPGATFTQRIAVRRSPDGGTTWLSVQFVTPPGARYNHQVIAPGTGGRIHVAFINGVVGAPATTAEYILSEDYGENWSAPQIVATLGADGAGQPYEMVEAGGWVHMVLGPPQGYYSRRLLAAQ